MILKNLWEELITDIHSQSKSFYLQKEDIIIRLMILIFTSPFILVLDIFLTPFYILYFILYKLIWK